MGALMFLPFMFLVVFSVSSTQISKPNIFKLEESQEPAPILETKSKANSGGQKGSFRQKRESSLTQGKPGMLVLQGQPGYSNQPGKPVSGHQQGNPGESNQKGIPYASIKQEELRLPSQQGKPGSPGQKGKPASPKDQGKPESPSQNGKPASPSNQSKPGSSGQGILGSSSQQGKPGSSSQQRKPRFLYKREERKNTDNILKDDTMEIQTGSSIGKNPTGKKWCESVYKPVCGSDGKTYGNTCVFKEAKRLSKGKLTLSHDGKC